MFADDKVMLREARSAVAGWLWEKRRLTLNPNRQHVQMTKESSTFVGYRVVRAGLSPGEKMKKRLVLNVRKAAARGPEALARTVRSYRALVRFGSLERQRGSARGLSSG